MAVDTFNMTIRSLMRDGVQTSAGSGHTLPVPSIKSKTLNSVIIRLDPSGKLIATPDKESRLQEELEELADLYRTAAARSCVEYDIKDPYVASEMNIDPVVLLDSTMDSLWTDRSYQLNEWRVLRQTGGVNLAPYS